MSAVRAIGLVAAAVFALLLMPSQFGGPASYVTTYGNSMEPGMHPGDLVITRPNSTYGVGDVVAFRSQTLNAVVLHRIVEARADGTFITKGDNNSWLDPDVISDSDILGAMWVFIPQGGTWLNKITSPSALGGLTFLFIILFIGAAARYGSDRTKARRHNMGTGGTGAKSPGPVLGIDRDFWIARRQELLLCAAVVGALGLLLGSLAWSQPTMVSRETSQTITDTVNFSYYATVPPSAAYQDTKVVAPDPVFRKLADELVVEYTYDGVPATVVTDVQLATTTGWTWRMPQDEPVKALAGTAQQSVRLDLGTIERLATEGTQAAGIGLGSIIIKVAPIVTSETGTFEPVFSLTMDADKVSISDGGEQSLSVTQESTVPSAQVQPNELSLLMFSVGIWPARLLGLLFVAVGAGLAAWARRLPKPDANTHLAASEKRLGHMVVSAAHVEEVEPVVDVTNLDALATIARRYALVILHVHQPSGDTYYVRDAQTTYRWMAPPHAFPGLPAQGVAAPTMTTGPEPGNGAGFTRVPTLNRM